MPDPGVRVALLARAGDVREQLRTALREAGAEVVAEGDPAELDPGTVAGRQPGVVVVSLEPSIEDALVEFEDLLALPGVQVIYDDAEVTGQLDGWDLARWARHLAAKLAGTSGVLPPAPADSERMPDVDSSAIQPGAPRTPAQEMDHHRLEDYAAESLQLSEWVPATPSLTDVEVEAPSPAVSADEPALDMDLELDLDLEGLEQAMTAPSGPAAPVEDSAIAADAPEPTLALDDEPTLSLDGEPTRALDDEPALSLEEDASLALEDDASLGLDDDASLALDDDASLGLDDDASLALEEDDTALDLDDADASPLALDDADPMPLALDDEPALELEDMDAPARGTATTGADEDETDLGEFLDLSVTESFEQPPETAGRTSLAAADEPLLADFEIADGPVNFSSFARDDDMHAVAMDDDIAALAAQLDANQSPGRHEEVREPDFARLVDEPAGFDAPLSFDEPPARAAASAAAKSAGGFGDLELTPMDGDVAVPAATRPAAPKEEPVAIDFGGLSLVDDDAPTTPVAPARYVPAAALAKPSALSLVDDDPAPAFAARTAPPADVPTRTFDDAPSPAAASASPPRMVATRRGALFVVAGLGGPDGVRQLLAALPADLPVPVLLYQHLDTGKHDRLVGQLAKASRLPLELAVPGQHAAAGRVAVLPPGIGVEARGDAFAFVPTASLGAVVAALPAADSAVLVLSGGDPSVISAALAMRGGGGKLFAQDPASCFDASAPQALVSAGAQTAPVPELAQRITECWS